MIFQGTTKKLHQLFDDMNKIHPTLKFTMQHTTLNSEQYEDKCGCEERQSIPFLDTSCSLEGGSIDTDLYRKETDRNQYLLPESCHPNQTTRSIPMSLGLRIVRICRKPVNRDKRFQELRQLLLDRGYKKHIIDPALSKARHVPRSRALLKRPKRETSNRPIFAVKYDPRLPPIQNIQAKHWRSMKNADQYLASVFPEPPLTAFRRQNNLSNLLIRAKVPEKPRAHPERKLKCMFKCEKYCSACPYIKVSKSVKIKKDQKWTFNRKLSCDNSNVIYMIECQKYNCKENRYIGETKRPLRYRLAEHRGYVVNNITTNATGAHFTSPGHSLSDMKIVILEQVKIQDPQYRRERERYFINKFNTYYKGMNRET